MSKKTKYTPLTKGDDYNPDFLLSLTKTELLCAIVNDKIDAKKLAKRELKNRGLNHQGEWVGFKIKTS